MNIVELISKTISKIEKNRENSILIEFSDGKSYDIIAYSEDPYCGADVSIPETKVVDFYNPYEY